MNMEPIFSISVYDVLFHNYVTYDSYVYKTLEQAHAAAKESVSSRCTVSARVEIGTWDENDECYYYKTVHIYGRKNPFRRGRR